MAKAAARAIGRSARLGAKILLGLVLGLVLLVSLALLAVNTPAGRDFVRARANAAIGELFRGKLSIERLGSLGLTGVGGVDAEVFDARGRRVMRANGLSVSTPWPRVVYAALFHSSEPLVVEIHEVTASHVEVRLIDDGTGAPTLAGAFEPREPARKANGPETSVRIDRIEIRHGWIHGGLSALPPLDAEIARVRAELSSEHGGTKLALRGAELLARALPLGADPRGRVELDLSVPRAGDLAVTAHFWGRILGDPVFAAAAVRGERLDAVAYISAISPRTVRALVPGLAPREGATLFAWAHGRLPELAFEGWLAGGFGRARFEGKALLEPTRIEASLEADDLDLRAIVEDAPATRIDLRASTRATLRDDGSFEANYRVSSAPSLVASYELSSLELAGRVQGDRAGRVVLSGDGAWRERGLSTRFDYSGELSPRTSVVVHVASEVEHSALLARFLPGARAAGRMKAVVAYQSAVLTLDVQARFAELALPDAVRASNVDIRGRVETRGSGAWIEADVAVREIALAGRDISRLRASAVGSPELLHVRMVAQDRRQGRIQAQGLVDTSQGLGLRTLKVKLGEGKERIGIAAKSVRVAGSEIRVEDLVLEDVGTARLSLVWRAGLERLDVEAKDLDLARLVEIADPESELRSAKASLEARYRRAERRGSLHASVSGVTLAELKDGALALELAWQGEVLTGELETQLSRGSRLRVRAEELRGLVTATRVEDLRAVTGSLFAEGTIRLSDAAPALRAGLLPLESARGTVQLKIALERKPDTLRPSLDANLGTRGLLLRGKRASVPPGATNEQASAADPWTLRGMDGQIRATLAGDSGEATVQARVFDRRGDLAIVTAETRLDGDLWRPRALLASLQHTPLTARVRLPERELEHWPPQFRPATVAGRVGLDGELSGSLRDPSLRARLAALGIRSSERGAAREPKFDLRASLDYTRAEGAFQIEGHFGKTRALSARGKWSGDAALLPAALAADARSPLRGEARVEVASFPLEIVPWLRHRRIEGRLSGRAELEGFGERPRLSMQARFERFSAGGVSLHGTRLSGSVDERSLSTAVEAVCKGGSVRGSARVDLRWGEHIAPTLGERLELALRARRFRIGSLQPMLQGSLSELDGIVDADMAAKLGQGPAELRGTAHWSGGVIQVPAVGQRFHDIDAKVRVAQGVVELPESRARGLAGRVYASGKAWLDGLGLRAAEAEVRIAEKEKIPVTVEGASLGDAWGKLGLRYARVSEDTTRLELDVRQLHVILPDASPNDVQGLEPAKEIRVGARSRDRRFVILPLQPIKEETSGGGRMLLDVELGRDVWIVQGQTVKVQLRGHMRAELQDPPRFDGRIELAGGTLDVSGKRFEVERGLIAFQGELEHATITATARWDSPLGYRVFADYTGTVADRKIVLHSEPPLSQDEVLSLLLLGTPEGSPGSGPPPDEASTALAVAGGTAAKGVNRVLSRFTQLDVSTRVDTSTGAARPELVVQLTPRVAARLTHALGEPAPGQSPDRNFLTLELRLVRRWSLSTVFGDQGSSAVDLIWRHRY